MTSILQRTGQQSLGQQNGSLSIQPSDFQRFLQSNNQYINTKKEDIIQVNKSQVKNKQDYAMILKQQIEEKNTLKNLQSQNQNYYKVTGYNPQSIEEILANNKRQEYIDNQQSQITYQPKYQQKVPVYDVNQQQNQSRNEDPNSYNYQNDSRPYQNGKSIRGYFQKEFQNKEQVNNQILQNNNYKQDLLRQIEEKKQREQELKRQNELEEQMYMEKLEKQREQLATTNPQELDKRQISSLRQQFKPSTGQKNQQKNPEMQMVEKRIFNSVGQQQQAQQQRHSEQQQQNPKQQQQDLKNDYYPIFIPPQINVPEPINFQMSEMNNNYNQSEQRFNENFYNQQQYAQTKVDMDVMKQYYQYQQQLFDRDMNAMREQLQKTDSNRVNAEKELMYLQERAREKKIWNLVDQDNAATMPNLAIDKNKGIFRTAKYALGNLTEAEKRERILLEYYKQDKRLLALNGLYEEEYNQQDYAAGKELQTQTDLIMAIQSKQKKQGNQKQQQNNLFDNETIEQIQSIRQHKNKIDEYIHQRKYNENEIIRDQEKYKELLEQNSLLQLMVEMQQQGDKKIMTPFYEPDQQPQETFYDSEQIKRQRTTDQNVKVTFTNDLSELRKQLNDNQPLDQQNDKDQQQDLQDNQDKQDSQNKQNDQDNNQDNNDVDNQVKDNQDQKKDQDNQDQDNQNQVKQDQDDQNQGNQDQDQDQHQDQDQDQQQDQDQDQDLDNQNLEIEESSAYEQDDNQSQNTINSQEIPKLKFDWQIQKEEEKPKSEIDPLDSKIDDVLNNINHIVINNKNPQTYYTQAVKASLKVDEDYVQNQQEQRPIQIKHFKPITLVKNKYIKPSGQIKFVPKIQEVEEEQNQDPFDKLDNLLKQYPNK